MTCNLLLVDDHSLIRAGVRALVLDIPGYAVIGEANDGSQLLEMVEQLNPDIVLLDISMKETGGLEALQRLKRVRPQSKVLILSMHTDPALIMQALESGAHGYLLKTLTNSNVHWSLDCQQRLNGIPEEMAVAAFRITQEAVTNILRHAQAKNLVIRVQRLPKGLTLLISDDGLGFAPAVNPGREGQRGMAGMAERIEQLGGTLNVISEPGKGTQIEALFPWAPRALERASTNKVMR